jgi:hypothetical protein
MRGSHRPTKVPEAEGVLYMSMRTALVPALLLLGATAHAGAVMEVVNKDLANGRPDTVSKTLAQDGKMFVDSGQQSSMIFKDDALYVMNPKDKTYSVLDRESMKKLADQLNPALAQLEASMAKMSPEQRAQMQKMMGSRMPGMGPAKTQEVRKTGRADKVAGYSCSYVEIIEDGIVQQQMCVAPASSLKGGDELMEAGLRMSAMMREMFSSMNSPMFKQMVDQQAAIYDKIGGVPVLTRHFVGGKPSMETTVKSMTSQSIPASTFEIPAGYTKKDMMAGAAPRKP